jgi:hypothetical protein
VPEVEREKILKILTGLEESVKIARKIQNCTTQGGSAQSLHGLLKILRTHLLCLQPSTFLLVPIGIHFEDRQGNSQEIDVMLAVECEGDDKYKATVVNVSEEGGVVFHSVFPSVLPTKNRYRTCMELGVFQKARILDMSFWMWLMILRCRCSQKHTADKLYEILGWLNNEPFEVTVDKAENPEPLPESLRSIQMGDSTYYKVVTESLFHLCRSAGVCTGSLKVLFHAIRVQAVRFAGQDLEHAPSVGHTDRMAIMLGVRQMTYSALKIHERMSKEGGGGEEGRHALLRLTVGDADRVQQLLARKQKVEEYPVMQSKLSLGDAASATRQPDVWPCFDHFLVDDDDKTGRGAKTCLFTGMPADLLPQRSEQKAKTLDEAVKVCRNLLQRLFVLQKFKAHCRLSSRLSLMMIERCFSYNIPVPLGPHSREKRKCVWFDNDILYSQQQSVVALMLSLAQHFMTNADTVQRKHDFHGVLITIMGCMTAICDAVLRSPCKDLDGNCSGIKQALDQGFGLSTDMFVKQAEVFPVFSASLLTLRAEVLDYFTELPAPGQVR